jgi:hypothetical protein
MRLRGLLVTCWIPFLPNNWKGDMTMEYTDLLTWGIMASVIGIGVIFLADWLIDRAFENYEK